MFDLTVHQAGCILTLKLMNKIFYWLSICRRVSHLNFSRPGHHKVCGFVLWGDKDKKVKERLDSHRCVFKHCHGLSRLMVCRFSVSKTMTLHTN